MSEVIHGDPRQVWPEAAKWHPTGMAEAVYRVQLTDGTNAYIRPDDGSAHLLARLTRTVIPAPKVLAIRGGWLMLSSLPGKPLHAPV